MAKSIAEVTQIIAEFSDARNWGNNDPNQLLTSLFIELGELAEYYQWKNTFKKLTPAEQKLIGYEFVDVIFYLFRLAQKSGIDIEEYFDEKLPKIAKKFPVNTSHNSAEYNRVRKEYRKTGKNLLYE